MTSLKKRVSSFNKHVLSKSYKIKFSILNFILLHPKHQPEIASLGHILTRPQYQLIDPSARIRLLTGHDEDMV